MNAIRPEPTEPELGPRSLVQASPSAAFVITLFNSIAATAKKEQRLTLPELAEQIRHATAPIKARLP